MDILVLSPTPSYPTDQGNRSRIANVCQYFKQRGARIHFLYFPREWGGRFVRKEYDGVAAQWDYFDVIPPSKDFVYRTENADFGIDDWWDDNIANHIRWKTNSYFYDAFIVNYAFFSKAFECVPHRTLKILDSHDRLGGRRLLLERNGIPPDFFYTTVEEEKVAVNRADVIIAITQSEAEYFRTLTERPVVTIGHVCNNIPIKAPAVRAHDLVFGFLGSDNIINVRNILDFFKYFQERFPKGIVGIEFRIAGSCCNRLGEIASVPGVKLIGRVDAVEDFYEMIDCVFVPFMFGTGQKIKVVEALACGVPLIATKSASDGIYSRVASHNCESFAQMIDLMTEFAGDSDFRRALQIDTTHVFNDYCARVEEALDALWNTIQHSRSCVLVDPTTLHSRLSTLTRAQIIDALVPLVPTLDALAEILEVTNKDQALASLRFVSRTLLRNDVQFLPDAVNHSTALALQHSAGVIVSLGDTGIVEPDVAGKVMLNILSESFDRPHGQAALFSECVTLMLRSTWSPNSREADAALKRMAPMPYERTVGRIDGVLFLARKHDDPAVLGAVQEILSVLRRVYRTDFSASLVDEDGTIVRFPILGEPIVQETLTDFYDVLVKSRAEAMIRNNIAVNLFMVYANLPNLFRILANDCGPIVSLRPDNHRAVGIDGELITSSPRETAVRVAALAASPTFCSKLSERWRLSVASLISTPLFKRSVSAELAAIKVRQLHRRLEEPVFVTDFQDEVVAVE